MIVIRPAPADAYLHALNYTREVMELNEIEF